MLEAKCIFCLHYPHQTGEKKTKVGRKENQIRERAESRSLVCVHFFAHDLVCSEVWLAGFRRRKIRVSQGMTST